MSRESDQNIPLRYDQLTPKVKNSIFSEIINLFYTPDNY